MAIHEPCEEVGVHRTKLDKIFEDKLPALSNCIKDMGLRCHTKREEGDKELGKKIDKETGDLDRRKLNAKYFYVIIGVLLSVVMGSVYYTHGEAQSNAEAHSEYISDEQMDERIQEVVNPVADDVDEIRETIKDIRQEASDDRRTILNAIKNLER